jgi:thiol-disulfide isomerase/thioredoxin
MRPTLSPVCFVVAIAGAAPYVVAADDKEPSRLIRGRVVDSMGKAPPFAKVFFGTDEPPTPYSSAWTTTADAEGLYTARLHERRLLRVGVNHPPTLPLRALVLSPGFRVSIQKIPAGSEAVTVNFILEAQPWKSTDLQVLDPKGLPVPGAIIEQTISIDDPWSHSKVDAEGRCKISMAPDQMFAFSVQAEGYRKINARLRGRRDEPEGIRLTLWPSIRGRAVDAQGRPLPGVHVGASILVDREGKKTLTPVRDASLPATANAAGEFSVAPPVFLRPIDLKPNSNSLIRPELICLADESFSRVAYRIVGPSDADKAFDIAVDRSRPVQIRVEAAVDTTSDSVVRYETILVRPPDPQPDSAFVLLTREMKLGSGGAKGGDSDLISERLPVGGYRLMVRTVDRRARAVLEVGEVDFQVPDRETEGEKITVRMTPPLRDELRGTQLPEIEAVALESGKPVHLRDFRGKVIVLDFWGYWCAPCIASMSTLGRIKQSFRDQPVVILALHDQSVQSQEEFARKIPTQAPIPPTDEGRFHILLDRPDPQRANDQPLKGSGITCKRYKIVGFPTLYVIDQQGKIALAGSRDFDNIKQSIEKLLANPPN